MARIEFKWEEPKVNSYEGANPDDFLSGLPDQYKTAGKPILLFLTSEMTEDSQEMKNIESSTFMDESVAIGATMFNQIKWNGLKVKEGHPYFKMLSGKELPRMVVIDANGQKVGAVEGKDVTATKVFGLMKKAASKTYKTDLDTVVKETKTILTEIDQIEAKRQALQTKKSSSTANKSAEWAKEEKALDEQMKAVEVRENALKKKWTTDKKVAKA
jgi:hypothetical protein